AVLIETPRGLRLDEKLASIPHCVLGEVTEDPRLALTAGGKIIWEDDPTNLAKDWGRTFREVLE
ncbi:MAG: hypothetical protein HYS33_05800, partial [Acidobacteria bacterium]|nr:hypothetical protein [Acidobacteriota bacterium]